MARPSRWIEHPEAKRMFLETVEQGAGCWLWTGYRDRHGYGRVSVNGRQVPASRAAYQLFVGELLPDLLVMHICDNPPCVRPDHLRLGSGLDNTQDSSLKGRQTGGMFRILPLPRPSRFSVGNRRPSNWFNRENAAELFLQSVRKTDTCWEWLGAKKRSGHGTLHVNGKSTHAHRASFLLFNGPIPDGGHVLHSCDNPPCVRPDHLHLGTNADNMREAAERKRFQYGDDHWSRRMPERRARGEKHAEAVRRTRPRGDDHWSRRMPERVNLDGARQNPARGAQNSQSKLTAQDIPVIREAVRTGTALRALARQYKVTTSVIRGAAFGPTWLHIPGALDRATTPKVKVPVGAAHYLSKLTDEIVLAMRQRVRDGERIKEVAASYGLNKTHARCAIRGISWKHLPGAVPLND